MYRLSKDPETRERYLELRSALMARNGLFSERQMAEECQVDSGLDRKILLEAIDDLLQQRLLKEIDGANGSMRYFNVRSEERCER